VIALIAALALPRIAPGGRSCCICARRGAKRAPPQSPWWRHSQRSGPVKRDRADRGARDPAARAERTLVLHLRRSRRKARAAAVTEVIAVLRGLGLGLDARAAGAGPLSDVAGVAWVTLSDNHLERALAGIRSLGYTEAVDLVSFTPLEYARLNSKPRITRWKGREVALVRVYEESDASLRAMAPDRRTFLLECADGVIRPITGYRGGKGPLEHRALPMADARLLVNLVAIPNGRLLDPFAGAGGVIIAANAIGFAAASMDCDRALRFGLAKLSASHVIGDASAIPFADGSFAAVATEPPYHASALATIVASIAEAARVVRRGGRIAYLVASQQAVAIRAAAERAGLTLELEVPIDRKGTAVTCLCWLR
jgi:hypothetical protein